MSELRYDYSILKKLDLELPPIGVKFSFFRPNDVPELEMDTHNSLCELMKKCQAENRPFYFSKEHDETCVGKVIMGMEQMSAVGKSGQIGPRLGVFDDSRANEHVYQQVPKMEAGVVNYVSFSPADQLTFEPDVLVISAPAPVAEIVMRAYTYSTGKAYKSCCTPVMGCAWMLVQPYMSGEVSFIVPALVHGPHGRQLWPSDNLVVSIPHQWIPVVLDNLRHMSFELSGHKSKQAYYDEFGGILTDLARQSQNP
jgi:uncharacterized protein (DUF169 family)